MKERPILFSGAMVRALLASSKTQTRRAVRLPHANPLGQWEPTTFGGADGGRTATGETIPEQGGIWHTRTGDSLACPYGQPGDRLWVREAWARTRVAQAMAEWIVYREGDNRTDYGGPWKPSIHMPRAASRILLEIVSVRVERLQDISESDCWAEGTEVVDGSVDDLAIIDLAKRMGRSFEDAAPTYAALWESINGAGSWDANPWVWVVEFKRVAAC
jgi:hypothetical protein